MPGRRFKWFLALACFALGLAVGWFAIAWAAWPVPPHDLLPIALGPASRYQYLQMVAESLADTGDLDAARARLASWPRGQLARDLADLQVQLEDVDPVQAAELTSLARALTAFNLPTEPARPATLAAELVQASPPGPAGTVTPTPLPSPTASPTRTAPASASPVASRPMASAAATLEPPEPTSTPGPSPTPGPTPQSLDRTENFLVLGTDTRPNVEGWRTDSIMIIAIDQAAGQVGILSIPRDLWVDIPGYGKERINAADYIGEKSGYPGGGPGLVRRVIEQTVGIPTQHWVKIQQGGLIKLVDALGGVTVNLACPLYEMAPDNRAPGGYTQLALPAGSVFLDGPTAKKFATYRYITGDFGRERRQQQLIWAIRNRALKGDVLPRIPQLWSALSDAFSTDLGVVDVASLATLGLRLQPRDVHASTLSMDALYEYTTSQGWQVLAIRSPAAIRAAAARIFAGGPLTDVGKPAAAQGCPAAPRGFKDLSRATPARP